MELLVVGTGYVGLVMGACLAEHGHRVTCLDIDKKKVEELKQGIIPIYEPGLEKLINRNTKANRLQFTTEYSVISEKSFEVCFLSLPTPEGETGEADLTYLLSAVRSIASQMNSYLLFVNKSTVPVGSADLVREEVQKVLAKREVDVPFDVASNPEFLKEGDAVADCLKPDRIIIGVDSEKGEELLKEVYAPFMFNHERYITMSIRSAELSKYASNGMLALRISFMNELAQYAEASGASVHDLRRAMGSDPRIGTHFLYAGMGYGGSCFPKDVRALKAMGDRWKIEAPITTAIDEVNEAQKRRMGAKITSYFDSRSGLSGKTLAIWGLAFKPGTCDMRMAPSLVLIEELLEKGCSVRLFDPIAMDKARKVLPASSQITWCEDEYDAAKGADGVVLVTEWKQFRIADLNALKHLMNHRVFFDGRNQLSFKKLHQHGFDAIGMGQPSFLQEAVSVTTPS